MKKSIAVSQGQDQTQESIEGIDIKILLHVRVQKMKEEVNTGKEEVIRDMKRIQSGEDIHQILNLTDSELAVRNQEKMTGKIRKNTKDANHIHRLHPRI